MLQIKDSKLYTREYKEVCATAVAALQEQLDRLGECEYCNSKNLSKEVYTHCNDCRDDNKVTIFELDINVTYCPNCGRKLTND